MRVFFFLIFINSLFCNKINLADSRFPNKMWAQEKEEGIILKIFEVIGTTNKFCVEFGAGDGEWLSNTAYMRKQLGWNALLLEGSDEDLSINLHREYLTKDNICDIFKKYSVPEEFDFLSIDLDGNDFYIFDSICRKYKPRVIVIETNPDYGLEEKVMPYDENHVFEQCNYYGTSLFAICKLAKLHNYTFVHLNSLNAFFIHNSVLEDHPGIFMHENKPEKLAKKINCWRSHPNRRKKMISYEKALTYLGY